MTISCGSCFLLDMCEPATCRCRCHITWPRNTQPPKERDMELNRNAVEDGVSAGVQNWMSTHDVTTRDAIVVGVEVAVGDWLNRNRAAIIAAIADRAG